MGHALSVSHHLGGMMHGHGIGIHGHGIGMPGQGMGMGMYGMGMYPGLGMYKEDGEDSSSFSEEVEAKHPFFEKSEGPSNEWWV